MWLWEQLKMCCFYQSPLHTVYVSMCMCDISLLIYISAFLHSLFLISFNLYHLIHKDLWAEKVFKEPYFKNLSEIVKHTATFWILMSTSYNTDLNNTNFDLRHYVGQILGELWLFPNTPHSTAHLTLLKQEHNK